MRNAEVAECESKMNLLIPHSEFRIPHSEFHKQGGN